MSTVAARFKGTDLIIKGDVEERLPRIKNGLIAHFPFDGIKQDRLTEYHADEIITTNRDSFPSNGRLPNNYNYANMKFNISGRVMCNAAVDQNVTCKIGFYYTKTDGNRSTLYCNPYFKLADIYNKWQEFIFTLQVPSNYQSNMDVFLQMEIPAGTSGYKVVWQNISYQFIEDPSYVTDNNTVIDTDYLSVKESSKNYLVNGDFSDGLTNWAASASATSIAPIYTPYGYGVRVDRKDGDNGNWPLSYVGPRDWTYNAGETWVWSFKCRVCKGTGLPFHVGWWINDNSAYINDNPMVASKLLEDGWMEIHAAYTFVNSSTSNTACGINSNSDYTIVDFADFRLEKRHFNTNTISGDRGDGNFGLNFSFPDIHSLTCEKRFATESSWTRYGLTKNASNIFTFYKNGVPTTEYVNKWQQIKVKGVGISRNVGYDISKYTDPIEKTYLADPLNTGVHSLASEDCGYLLRTFVYASADSSIVQKFHVDQYGAIRVNNGSLVSMGDYTDSDNPNITISLVKGWNIIEIVWMDGDTGGIVHLISGNPLNQDSHVLYMTAELPIEASSNEPYFNEKSNSDIRNMSIYNRELSATEMRSVHGVRGISIDKDGNLNMVVKESLPYIPSDAYYFPLGVDGKDITGAISASSVDNIAFEDGWAWVGTSVTNLIDDPYLQDPSKWSTFSTGSLSPALRGGYISKTSTVWGNINKPSLLSDSSIRVGSVKVQHVNGLELFGSHRADPIYLNTWGNYPHSMIIPVNDDTLDKLILVYDGSKNTGNGIQFELDPGRGTDGASTFFVTEVMLTTKSFLVPFVESTRGDGKLQFNLYDSIGLRWNQDWSLVYFKIPISCSSDNNYDGINAESLGRNGNTVGTKYIWWGKNFSSYDILNSSGGAVDPAKYFNNPRMVTVVNKNNTITFKEYDYFGNVWTRTESNPSASLPNGFLTQNNYDLQLGGWDDYAANACNSYYRDLIAVQRAITDDEIHRIFKTCASSRDDAFYISGRVVRNPSLN